MTNDPLYREIIMENWEHPQNYGVIKNADIDMTADNPACGDNMRVTLKLKDNKILDIKFTSNGCAVSKAAMSVLTQAVKGKTVGEFKKMTAEGFLKSFGAVFTPSRTKCALLGFSTLKKAL
jgi:nitrogen fixation protein NifU and related proteins